MDKSTETVTVQSETISEERRESMLFRKIVELWPLWIVVLGGITACYQFYFTVKDLAAGQARWQTMSEGRRDKNRDEIEAIRIKQAQDEKDIEWLKELRRQHG